MTRLVESLYESGADVFLVCNRSPTDEEKELWGAKCVAILERANFGQDWGGYKEGWAYLQNCGGYSGVPLILANDSVYYLWGTKDLVQEIVDSPDDVCAQHINKESVFHAQSWLIKLNVRVVESGFVEMFFRKYRVAYGREHAIHNGELRLSRKLFKRRYRFAAIYSGSRLTRELNKKPELAWPPEILSAGINQQAPVNQWSEWDELSYEMKLAWLREQTGVISESRNVASSLPLTFARTFGSPIKLDLLKRHTGHSSGSISTALEGSVDPEDLSELERWFDNTPTWASTTGIHRAFQHYDIS